MTAPTLVLMVPLRLELAALGPGPKTTVEGVTFCLQRTGMGLAKAAAAAGSLSKRLASGGPEAGAAAVAISGLGGALADGLEPGDMVVASQVVDAEGKEVAKLASAPLLAGELSRLGIRARTGTVVSTDHIVVGEERAKLASLGADIVDMESSAIAGFSWGDRPLAVLRAVSDSPGHELFSPAGAVGVGRALRSLRAARPALARWAAAAGPRDLVLAQPRGFCAGVNRAIATVEEALHRFGAPVYVRRQIVHNTQVVGRLEAMGAVFVEELSEVPDGARVVYSAHGVGREVLDEAEARQLPAIDATCPLVTKVHNEGLRFAAAGRQVILVGHAGHDEVEGTLGTIPGARLVGAVADVEQLDLDPSAPTAFITQTTLATDDVAHVVKALEEKFIDLAHPPASDICYASQNRQEGVRTIAAECDLVLVVGSANSSNSNRMVEVARRCGTPSHLVDRPGDLQLAWLAGKTKIGVSAGASAPEGPVQELVDCLSGLGPVSLGERSAANERVNFPLPLEVR